MRLDGECNTVSEQPLWYPTGSSLFAARPRRRGVAPAGPCSGAGNRRPAGRRHPSVIAHREMAIARRGLTVEFVGDARGAKAAMIGRLRSPLRRLAPTCQSAACWVPPTSRIPPTTCQRPSKRQVEGPSRWRRAWRLSSPRHGLHGAPGEWHTPGRRGWHAPPPPHGQQHWLRRWLLSDDRQSPKWRPCCIP